MKIQKQKRIDYDSIGYGESNGWRPMYDWNKTKKAIRAGNIAAVVIISITVYYPARQASTLLVCMSALAYLLVVIPIHEVLLLAACTPNVFSDKCHIFVGFSGVSAFYDGEIPRGRSLLSLLLPFAVITVAFVCLGIIARDLWVYAAIIAMLNAGGSWTDIYMFFHVLKNVPKKAVVYGNRYHVQK